MPMSSAWLSLERLIGYGLIAAFWIPSAMVGEAVHAGIRVALLLLASWQFGQAFLPLSWSGRLKLVVGLTMWMSALSLLLTVAYYLSIPLTDFVYTGIETFLIVASTVILCLTETKKREEKKESIPFSLRETFLAVGISIISLAAFALFARTLSEQATTISVQTPWTLLPKGIFLVITIPFFAALIAAWKDRSRLMALLTSAASWLSITIITPLLYPLGYGFDGFIHRASQQVLLTSGTLHPKPFYYLGQYVWTTWLVHAFDLSLRSVDVWLLPLSLLLPLLALFIWIKEERALTSWRLPLTLLFLPLGAFVSTTPQSFSYVLGFAALIAALWPRTESRSWLVPILWVLWATSVHPLGGLPFLAVVIGLLLSTYLQACWKKNTLLALATLGGLLAIPFAFWAQSSIGGATITWSWNTLFSSTWQSLLSTITIQPKQTLSFWVDSTEWTTVCFQLFLIIVAIFQTLFPKRPAYRWLGLMGLGLLGVRWILEHVATFSFLIAYEQNNYTDRLTVLSALFLAPGTAHWVEERLYAISKRSTLIFSCLLITFTALWSIRVYDALPRYDAAKASSGWNVSRADFEAVHWIHDQAKETPYTVLANQSVSAAALETYGFLRYTNDTFYYPLPTGGPLYQLFLKVSSTDGTLAEIKKAAELTQSKTVFVVIDAYWWNADAVNERLAETADKAVSFENGKVWVYRFEVK